MKRMFTDLPKEKERKCAEEVITRVQEIEGSDVGIIAATDIINIVLENLGSEIYNKGINDAKKLLQIHANDLETEVDMLKRYA